MRLFWISWALINLFLITETLKSRELSLDGGQKHASEDYLRKQGRLSKVLLELSPTGRGPWKWNSCCCHIHVDTTTCNEVLPHAVCLVPLWCSKAPEPSGLKKKKEKKKKKKKKKPSRFQKCGWDYFNRCLKVKNQICSLFWQLGIWSSLTEFRNVTWST